MDAGSGTRERSNEGGDRSSRAFKTTQQPMKQVSQKIKNPSSPRLISTSLLRVSPLFQIWPINLVVYQESYSL